MGFIDPHLHTDMIDDVKLEYLSMAGMEAAVIPSPHMFKGLFTADAVFRLWRRFLDFEVKSAKLCWLRLSQLQSQDHIADTLPWNTGYTYGLPTHWNLSLAE